MHGNDQRRLLAWSGVALAFMALASMVLVTSSLEAGEAVLTIANSGPVIAPDELASLVRPFQRLGADRTSHGGGHGLGLSIIDAIATAHGAKLAVHVQPTGGLQVEVRFPNIDATPDVPVPWRLH